MWFKPSKIRLLHEYMYKHCGPYTYIHMHVFVHLLYTHMIHTFRYSRHRHMHTYVHKHLHPSICPYTHATPLSLPSTPPPVGLCSSPRGHSKQKPRQPAPLPLTWRSLVGSMVCEGPRRRCEGRGGRTPPWITPACGDRREDVYSVE